MAPAIHFISISDKYFLQIFYFFSLGVLHKSVSPDHRGREVQEGPPKGHIWSALPLRQRWISPKLRGSNKRVEKRGMWRNIVSFFVLEKKNDEKENFSSFFFNWTAPPLIRHWVQENISFKSVSYFFKF